MNTEIRCTQDYTLFKYLKQNRNIRENGALKESMRLANDLKTFPIIVNKNYEILDGQHRFKYAQLFNYPVYFKIVDDFDMHHVRNWNSCSKLWKAEDYLKSFVDDGYEQYIQLNKLYEYSKIPLSTLLSLLDPSTLRTQSFKKGDFKLKEPYWVCLEKINKLKDLLRLSADYKIKTIGKSGHYVFYKMLSNPNYNHNHMLRQIERNPDAFVFALKFSSAQNIENHMKALYNKGRRINLL